MVSPSLVPHLKRYSLANPYPSWKFIMARFLGHHTASFQWLFAHGNLPLYRKQFAAHTGLARRRPPCMFCDEPETSEHLFHDWDSAGSTQGIHQTLLSSKHSVSTHGLLNPLPCWQWTSWFCFSSSASIRSGSLTPLLFTPTGGQASMKCSQNSYSSAHKVVIQGWLIAFHPRFLANENTFRSTPLKFLTERWMVSNRAKDTCAVMWRVLQAMYSRFPPWAHRNGNVWDLKKKALVLFT